MLWTSVDGVFAKRTSVSGPAGSLLMEVEYKWQIGRRYFSQASMKELLDPEALTDTKSL